MSSKGVADRTVTGVVAGMIVATAAATAVGFWLSYAGLHVFALRAGLHGPEAWAWPASVDLFILAGEAGVTISALRREKDPMAWGYLGLGFAASVAGNVLHVARDDVLAWTPYAVAAVPPMAAMLALAALLRHAYRIATDRAPAQAAARVTDAIPADIFAAAKASYAATVAAGNPLSLNQVMTRFQLTRAQATKVRQDVAPETREPAGHQERRQARPAGIPELQGGSA
jgi:hypothetical protein